MANNYLEFSEALYDLTTEEMDWIDEQLTLAEDNMGALAPIMHEQECLEFRCEVKRDERIAWLYCEESGSPEGVVMLVKEFLLKFRPKEVFAMSWSNRCSKPRLGEFGGGAVVVTAREEEWMNAEVWAQQRATELKKQMKDES